MLNGAFSLLEQSLRLDSRSRLTHWVRWGLCGAIYISLCANLLIQESFSAPGLQFFQGIAWLDLCFVTLLGIGYFSTAITEEKEEDTLGLMLMAGISPIGILAGKSGGRFCQALLLITVQYPFMLLSITMGGVMAHQIWSMSVALVAFAVFLSGFGLFCSTIASNNRSAGTMMIVGLVVYFLLPMLAQGLAWLHFSNNLSWTNELNLPRPWWNTLDAAANVSIVVRMNEILASGFSQPAFGLQVFSNMAAGFLMAGLSWLSFGIATRSPSTEANTRGFVARRRRFLQFDAGRCWINPFIWKDFYFVAGGIGTLVIRLVYYLGLVALAYAFGLMFDLGHNAWSEYSLLLITFSLPIDAALLVARAMHDEVRAQTLSALLMLPRGSHGIVYSKVAGALLGWFPGPLVGLVVMLGSETGQVGLKYMLTHEEGLLIPIVFMFLILVPNYAAFAALYVRWGAVPLAIGFTIATYLALAICLILFETHMGVNLPFLVMFLGTLLLAINTACHLGVLFRFQALAER